jgi:dTDP-4-amino-4,6-dideoxygalactose transaminase
MNLAATRVLLSSWTQPRCLVQQQLQRGLVAYSLHATKLFGIGEGGILIACDPDIVARARQYSNFGMINRIGYGDGANTKMSEYHTAVGLAQVQRWEASSNTSD